MISLKGRHLQVDFKDGTSHIAQIESVGLNDKKEEDSVPEITCEIFILEDSALQRRDWKITFDPWAVTKVSAYGTSSHVLYTSKPSTRDDSPPLTYQMRRIFDKLTPGELEDPYIAANLTFPSGFTESAGQELVYLKAVAVVVAIDSIDDSNAKETCREHFRQYFTQMSEVTNVDLLSDIYKRYRTYSDIFNSSQGILRIVALGKEFSIFVQFFRQFLYGFSVF